MEDTNNKRKRLIFRSWHRGTKEMDLLLGSFAEKNVPGFDEEQLSLYDELLHESDPDLYNWMTGKEEVPADKQNSVLDLLCRHQFAT